MKFCYNTNFTLFKHPKNLGLSYRMDLYFWDCLGREKNTEITEEIWTAYMHVYCILLFVKDSCLFFSLALTVGFLRT